LLWAGTTWANVITDAWLHVSACIKNEFQKEDICLQRLSGLTKHVINPQCFCETSWSINIDLCQTGGTEDMDESVQYDSNKSYPALRFISLAWAQNENSSWFTLNYRMRVFSRTPSWVVWSLHSRCTAMSCQSCSSKKKLCWARQRFSCLAVGTNTSTSSYMALLTLKGIVHPKINISSPQAIPDLEKCSITLLLTSGSCAVNGCRQNESPNSW